MRFRIIQVSLYFLQKQRLLLYVAKATETNARLYRLYRHTELTHGTAVTSTRVHYGSGTVTADHGYRVTTELTISASCHDFKTFCCLSRRSTYLDYDILTHSTQEKDTVNFEFISGSLSISWERATASHEFSAFFLLLLLLLQVSLLYVNVCVGKSLFLRTSQSSPRRYVTSRFKVEPQFAETDARGALPVA
jgi:hypothetical protein